MDHDANRFLRQGASAALVASIAPPLLALLLGDVRILKPTVAIALLGIVSGIAWVAVAGYWLRPRRASWLMVGAFAGAMISFASTVARHPERNWDYVVTYELPAQQLAAGVNPYIASETTNPPTWAQVTGLAASALRGSVLAGASPDVLWFWVFYAYQALQLAMLAVLLGMVYRVARDAGHEATPSALIAAFAPVVCSPLQESLHLNQLNLLVLVLTMASVLLTPRHWLAAGLAAGFGGAVKLYPLGVALLWLVRTQLRPLVAAFAGAAAIVMAGWSGWLLYFDYLQRFQRPAIVRDAGLHAIASNVTRALGGVTGASAPSMATASLLLWLALDVLVVAWVVWRLRTRDASPWEVVAALPLIFPLAWVHHYLLVLPLGVARLRANAEPAPMALAGGLLALVVPGFDTFPLGLARPIGTLLLIGGAHDADRPVS